MNQTVNIYHRDELLKIRSQKLDDNSIFIKLMNLMEENSAEVNGLKISNQQLPMVFINVLKDLNYTIDDRDQDYFMNGETVNGFVYVFWSGNNRKETKLIDLS